ncbi:Aldolase-type TIM barrel [Cordyceps fumosorosea ARSEF 2679]|uniref:Aldolase-type TIM barrel n=1 Tax=Cordyceps fumosorosea (strain ARSEF 2679) TaxID=1081104 RepID=A0A167TLU9_CORFA|nr:Aldolase-type TIM barrel [Cordyceps fumosorosea ARSEF 2679]OAA60731.1 Aldolase-type TIM barrel [Cordyceps fumosorosea ARSEF 2679]
MVQSKLQEWFPWTTAPVIINAPMIGVACPKLAAEVSKAGGIGLISCLVNVSEGSPELTKAHDDLAAVRQLLEPTYPASPYHPLPAGMGCITGHESVSQFVETVVPIIAAQKPAALWLFAPDGNIRPHGRIIAAVRELLPAEGRPRVFVQVGTVAAAREAVADGADVVVCQGVDAGGHQFRRGAGVVSLVPEVRRMLAEEFAGREVALVAAGGIVDGKGVAAALALGADGVVMGTRFTVSDESVYPDFRKAQVLNATDGGFSTVKSPFNDQINNSKLWGPLYDGRAIVSEIHEGFLAGATVEECQEALKQVSPPEEATKLINTWAGTGVGLVRTGGPAGQIIKDIRRETKETIQALAKLV